MGESRSAAFVIAYLMQKYDLTPEEALSRIRESRPTCEPNNGFMEQLNLYRSMDCNSNVEDHPLYQRWLYRRELERSLAAGRAPEAVHFVDESDTSHVPLDTSIELRCRKCRYDSIRR